MTLAAIELNDQALQIRSEEGSESIEPGFARLTGEGIVSGEDARAAAWREPQHIYNQYWCHLNTNPLTSQHRFARHHADIAFAQLKKLWEGVGSPDSLMVLVPASFSDDQLALSLGMIEALPSSTLAVLDSALAACGAIDTDTLYVDVQMHETVITVCEVRAGKIAIAAQEVFPGVGATHIQNSVARYISDHLIESYRFDPLHASETEQDIFDRIPGWLASLRWESSVSTKLTTDQGVLPCIIERDTLRATMRERTSGLTRFVDKHPECRVVLSHVSSQLAAVSAVFEDAGIASEEVATEHCLMHRQLVLDQAGDLIRIRELAALESHSPSRSVNGEPLATHLLYGEHALPLSRPLSIHVTDGDLRLSNELDADAAITFVIQNDRLETLHRNAEVSVPATCRPGELVRIGEHELKLIRVSNH